MFKVPEKQRLRQIEKDLPDIISCMFLGNGGYLKKVKYALLLDKLAKEFDVKYSVPIKKSKEYLANIFNKNEIPSFVVLETCNGSFRVVFGDDLEKDPIMALISQFGDECTNGSVYMLSSNTGQNSHNELLKTVGVKNFKRIL